MDLQLAALFSHFCDIAYEDYDEARLLLPIEYELKLIEHKDTQAYVIKGGGLSVIVFRGTEVSGGLSWKDVRSNMKLARTRWSLGGTVHRGYREALLQISEQIQNEIRECPWPIYFAGHSLGGCLATLASQVWPVAGTYTYGAPRVGDKKFVAGLKKVYRFTYGRDIAPKYPFPYFGYRHGGKRFHASRNGRFKFRGFSPLDLIIWPGGIRDHSITRYRAALSSEANS